MQALTYPGETGGIGHDINDRGTVVTSAFSSTRARYVGSLYASNGAHASIGPFDHVHVVPSKMNNSGQVMGTLFHVQDLGQHGFLWDNGRFAEVNNVNSLVALVDINQSGQVVGVANNNSSFLYEEGRIRDLGSLGGATTLARDLNDAGDIVGTARRADGNERAFVYRDGVISELPTLGGNHNWALAINELGHIVGFSETLPDRHDMHVFLYADGELVDLSKWVMESFDDVALVGSPGLLNDAGQIVLAAGLRNGASSLLVLTPIPEPSTYALMLAGLLTIAFAERRRTLGRDCASIERVPGP